MRSNIVLAAVLLGLTAVVGGFGLSRVDRALDCLAHANAELAKANTQLSIANRHIAEMHVKLADTSRKLDETNANLALTNTKIVALDSVFQRLMPWRK
jgi:hypothetical protein